jgi:hypothetical protein
MDIDKKLDLLKNIQTVDEPPFLLTRIRQRIQSLELSPAPRSWKWALALSGAAIVVLNLGIIFKTANTSKNTSIESIAVSMNLSSGINLYNE